MTTLSLISADNHVFEPLDLWQQRLPEHLRERGPRMEQVGDWWCLVVEGIPPRKLARVNAEREEHHGVGGAGGSSDLDARRADMAADGVVAEVIYPTFGLFVDMLADPELQMACARAYNDWLAETFIATDPSTFIPSALVPVRDVASATAELERVAGLGYRSALIPTSPPEGLPYNLPDYDPLWTVASEANIPLSMHTGTGALPQHEKGPGGAVINYAKVGLLSAETLTYFVASGTLQRHPDLRLVFVESGAGWLAYCCERMDEAFEEHEQWVNPKLAERPSDYVRRQCLVTLGADRAPLLAREITGVDALLWASDYPHPEGTFPESQRIVREIFAGIPDDERDAIVAGNAARLYGVPLPDAA
jgi:predicted TIM-barrel fold metal-dependent hydrolase